MTVTLVRACAICGSGKLPEKENARHCDNCNGYETETYKAVARLKKAMRLHDYIVPLGATGPEIAQLPTFGRRLVEQASGVPESSDTTWALVALLSSSAGG